MTTATKRTRLFNRVGQFFGRGQSNHSPTYNDQQRSYLVDCGMHPDASDADVQRFAMGLDDFTRAELDQLGDQPDYGGDVQRGDDSDNDDDDDEPPIQRGGDQRPPQQPTQQPPVGNPGDTITRGELAGILRDALQQRDDEDIRRCEMIAELDGDDIPRELVTRAHNERWSPERISREFLSASRQRPGAVGRAPAGHVTGRDQRQTLQALQGALLLREGIALDDPILRTQQAQAMLRRIKCGNVNASWITRMASDQELRGGDDAQQRETLLRARDNAHGFAGTHLVDICRMSLELSGKRVPFGTDHEEIVRTALSTAQLSAVFSTSVNMQILQAFMAKPDTTRGWTYDADVNGFHVQQRGRMTKGSGVKKLSRGGTPSDITFSDVTENYAVERYAGRFVIDEQDIIDNTLGGITEHTTRELGELLAEIRINLIYGLLLSNPTMRDGKALFHTDHGNTGTGLGWGVEGFRKVKKAMATQTENGRPISCRLAHVIAPEELEFRVNQLLGSAEFRGQGSETGTKNPHQNTATPHFDQRLDNGCENPADETFYSGSLSTWYGAANDGRAGIEVGYRRGTGRAPRIESGRLPVSEGYGYVYRGNLDIGVKAISWEGLFRAQE
ncbi:hypothetical protein [Roseiconus lacunae]|uniref:Uncharacterized protein n=1 Tax=Roseiconus lacunae TaxID=2605694 RepID=A0ABT7PH84_9BACT|nr:hypothetical protein [Roseiconus lacunae]MDM4015843.1 hypothetical protein [Roseiconus lacunae]